VRLLHPRTDQQRWRLIHLSHQSVCEMHLSYRQARRRLEQYGASVSLGQVFNYVKTYECSICAGQSAQGSQESQDEPAHVHQGLGGGGLTGMITGS
jgi:hypothetical protein